MCVEDTSIPKGKEKWRSKIKLWVRKTVTIAHHKSFAQAFSKACGVQRQSLWRGLGQRPNMKEVIG